MNERQYRSLPKDSASSIKDFAKDRKAYYKRHILGEDFRDEEDEDRATLMGSLVDSLVLCEEHEFDNKFHVSGVVDIPTGLMLQFVEALYRRTREQCNEAGELMVPFTTVAQSAYNDVRFDHEGNVVAFKRDSFEKVLEKFDGSPRQYYDEICKVRPSRLMVITLKDIEIANNIKSTLLHNSFTKEIMQRETNQRYKVHNQFMTTFTYSGLELKAMLDKIIVDEEEKTVSIYDLKVTWNVEGFYYNFYLKRYSYIQALIYHLAVKDAFPGYTIIPMQFIVSDSTNYLNPLIYKLDLEDLVKGKEGFMYNNKEYIGVDILIEDLIWHKESGIWNISRENYENNGICTLK